jgi:hypothetical protein
MLQGNFHPSTESVRVECDFTSFSDEVITLVHHNTEQEQLNSGYEDYAGYERNITYFVSLEAIAEIKMGASRCEQFFWIMCHLAEALMLAYWYGFDGNRHAFEYEEDVLHSNCQCRLRSNCDMGLTEFVSYPFDVLHV